MEIKTKEKGKILLSNEIKDSHADTQGDNDPGKGKNLCRKTNDIMKMKYQLGKKTSCSQ